jgi:hypothetical protein
MALAMGRKVGKPLRTPAIRVAAKALYKKLIEEFFATSVQVKQSGFKQCNVNHLQDGARFVSSAKSRLGAIATKAA